MYFFERQKFKSKTAIEIFELGMIFPFYEYLKKTDAYFLRDKGLTCNLNQNETNLFFEQVASLLKKIP